MASEQPQYVVLASPSDVSDTAWIEIAQIEASNGDSAIIQARGDDPKLKADKGAQFVAVAASRFKPRRMRRQLVTRYALDDADVPDDEVPGEDPQQERLT